MKTNTPKPKPAPKSARKLKVRTTVKAGDPGMRLNHNEKLVAAR